jgi:hypothetical protein
MYGAVNVTKSQFLEILYAARLEAFTPDNIAGAWRGTGLIPYDPTPVIAKVEPISDEAASATLEDDDDEVSRRASTSVTASKINSLAAKIRQGEQSSSVDSLVAQLRELALTAVHERDVHSKQNKEIIAQRRKKRMESRKACGEGRVLKVAEIEAEIVAKEAHLAVETAEKERRKALKGKVGFAKLVWKEFQMHEDIFFTDIEE